MPQHHPVAAVEPRAADLDQSAAGWHALTLAERIITVAAPESSEPIQVRAQAVEALCGLCRVHAVSATTMWMPIVALAKPAAVHPETTLRLAATKLLGHLGKSLSGAAVGDAAAAGSAAGLSPAEAQAHAAGFWQDLLEVLLPKVGVLFGALCSL